MRYNESTERRIEDLDETQLRALMDRIMRASADRGYFGDKGALNEIDSLIMGREESQGRLFPDELVEGKRTRTYEKTVYVSSMSKADQENIEYRVKSALSKEGYEGEELKELVQDAMDSRLSDLEGTITIDRYLK
tara:strand:- start:58 stop:462 length:405 start_codon:yes stop_codon:yes gene_type:complete